MDVLGVRQVRGQPLRFDGDRQLIVIELDGRGAVCSRVVELVKLGCELPILVILFAVVLSYGWNDKADGQDRCKQQCKQTCHKWVPFL